MSISTHLLSSHRGNPSCPIDDLPLLGQTDERQLLTEWNATAAPHDRTRCLHQLLEASARSTPDATAVIAGSATSAIECWKQQANRLAHLLGRQGVGRGALVAVCLERTVDIPIALAAVLKAGAAYVPLDPTHPEERLHYILRTRRSPASSPPAALLPIFDGVTATDRAAGRSPAMLLAQQPDSGADGGGSAGRPRLCDLYVRIDRPAQRRRDRTPQRRQLSGDGDAEAAGPGVDPTVCWR